MRKYLFVILTFFLFVACGGGGASGDFPEDLQNTSYTGYLYDSKLTGVDYYVNNEYIGKTVDGKFTFSSKDDVILFSLGSITLGSATGSIVINNNITTNNEINIPMILGLEVDDNNNSKALIIGQLLQALDTDDDPDTNGINLDTSCITNLLSSSYGRHNFSQDTTDIDDLNQTLFNLCSKELVNSNDALVHMNTYTSIITSGASGLLVQPSLNTPLTQIKTRNTIEKKVKIYGNIGTEIYIGEPNATKYASMNFDNNMSDIIYTASGITIGSLGYAEIILAFDNDYKTYFDYFIKTYSSSLNSFSTPLHVHVLKDHIPPYVAEPVINITINEEQYLLRDINASDESDTEFYKIIQYSENTNSVDGADFTISDEGIVTFITKPDFEKNVGRTYSFLARVVDLGNVTDVKLNVTLQNILDSAPVLSNNGNFSTYIYEDHNISSVDYASSIVYDLSSTVDYSLNSSGKYVYPDNDPSLSPKYFAIDSNASNYFDIDRNTGILTLKDNINDLMDYEKTPNEINITFSVENNNTFDHNDTNIIDTNTTYGSLIVNIVNKIDTTPALNTPSDISVYERSTSIGDILSTITKDYNNSDTNPTMSFSITGGNSEDKFAIDSLTGVITLKNELDYETTREYNLTITATNTFNTWYDKTDHNSSVQLNITVINEIDNPPFITLIDNNASIPESTLSAVEIAHFDVNGTIYDQNQTTTYEIFRVDKNTLTDISNIPFSIDGSGTITTNRDLIDDYEELVDENDTIFTLYVRAYNNYSWENNSINYSNEITFTINITNVTDNIPTILPSDTNVSIPEDYGTNTTIITFDVNGTQFDQNTIDRYTIVSGNDKNLFDITISGTEGSLVLIENNRTLGATNALDWETEPIINLTIAGINTWYDGVERSSLEHSITINLDNVIEVPPTISAPSTIDVHENFSVGDFVGYIETSGTGVDENSVNNFSIVSSDGKFALQQYQGTPEEDSNDTLTLFNTVVVDETLDYDINTSHQITLKATNDAGTSEKNISINVIDDINTNLPLLTIIVSFSDVNVTTPLANIKDLINTNMYDYFFRVSYNKFSFSKAQENYGEKNVATGTPDDGVIQITLPEDHPQIDEDVLILQIRNILTQVSDDNLTDFSTFDANSDGTITKDELQILLVLAEDATIQLDAGLEGSYTLASALNLNGVNVASVGDGNCVVVGETDVNNNTITIGIVAKLISEKLFGFLPEDSNYIYDNYDLMGTGYKGYVDANIEGSTPVHPSIFNKSKQGWVQPVTLRNTTHDLLFYNTHDMTDFNAYKIYINSSDYYLLENRNYTEEEEEPSPSLNYDNGLRTIVTNFTGGLVTWKYTPNEPIKLNLIEVGSQNYTFTKNQAVSDLPTSVQTTFEFVNTASIDDGDDSKSKQLQIEIEVK